jgi:hypothetical protein
MTAPRRDFGRDAWVTIIRERGSRYRGARRELGVIINAALDHGFTPGEIARLAKLNRRQVGAIARLDRLAETVGDE